MREPYSKRIGKVKKISRIKYLLTVIRPPPPPPWRWWPPWAAEGGEVEQWLLLSLEEAEAEEGSSPKV